MTNCQGRTERVHDHTVYLPAELRELVLEHVEGENKRLLLALGAVCPCWLSTTRSRVFRHVTARGESAEDLLHLISAPTCTFLASIEVITLQVQAQLSITSDTLLRRMSQVEITPRRLELDPDSSVSPPPRHSALARSLTELKLDVMAYYAFEGKLSQMVEFISAFPALESLDIDCFLPVLEQEWWKDERSGSNGHKFTVSPKLSTLCVKVSGGERDNDLTVTIPWTLLFTMPKLESLTLSLRLQGNGDFLSTLTSYFRLQGRHLKHLSLELHTKVYRGPTVDIPFDETFEVLIPISEESPGVLAKDSCSFPELLTLSISNGHRYLDRDQELADCGRWILALARHSPKLQNLMIPTNRLLPDLNVTTAELAELRFEITRDHGVYRGYRRVFS